MSSTTDKEFASVQAAFALKGHQLIRCAGKPGGDYLVICWAWTRYCKDWPAVLAFLEQIGGRV